MVGRVPGRAPELGGLNRAGHAAARFIAETPGLVGPGPSGCAGQSGVGAGPGAGPPVGRTPRQRRGKTSGHEEAWGVQYTLGDHALGSQEPLVRHAPGADRVRAWASR